MQFEFEKLSVPTQISNHKWLDETIPLVSVFSWSYNNRDHIRESIDSLLIQETIFPVEIIIHDDASSDGTAEIIKEYEAKYPKLFRNVLQSENQWSQGKSVMTSIIDKPKGKYIALTHGDDYWTDPHKLQKQVDFLEQNKEFVLSFHNAIKLYSDSKTSLFNKYNTEFFTSYDLWDQWLIPTASVLYRNMPIEYPDWFFKATHGDLALFLLLGEHGDFACLNEAMCVYRIHESGVTNSHFGSIDHMLQHIEQLKSMDHHFGQKFHKQIMQRSIEYRLSASYLFAKSGSKKNALNLVLESMRMKFFKTLKNQYFYKALLYLLFSWKSKNH